jgi:hypothetical protein
MRTLRGDKYMEKVIQALKSSLEGVQGEELSQVDWSRKLGGNSTLVCYRIKKGYTKEQAVSLPITRIKNYEKRN